MNIHIWKPCQFLCLLLASVFPFQVQVSHGFHVNATKNLNRILKSIQNLLTKIPKKNMSLNMKKTVAIYYNIILHLMFSLLFVSQGCGQKKQQLPKEESYEWKKLGPGGGGSTFIPTFSYTDPSNFVIRCDMTGAYVTTNGGLSYSQVNFPNGSTSFAYDPSDSKVLYVGSASLHVSRDGGRSWERIFPSQSEIVDEQFRGDHANFYIKTQKGSIYPDQGVRIRNIRVDPTDPMRVYFSIGDVLYHTNDGGKTWQSMPLSGTVEFVYINTLGTESKVYVYTSNYAYSINPLNTAYKEWHLPQEMQPAFSFTGGRVKGTNQTIVYALHNYEPERDSGKTAPTTLWYSTDMGEIWQQSDDDTLLNAGGVTPTYSSLSAAENDAANVYVIASSYVENKEGKKSHWYGALKSTDLAKSWQWVWKGGGGSGRYGVKDGQDAANLKDAWVQQAFGGEYIRLIDVGVAPNDGNVAIVTDWYRTMKTTNGGKSWKEVYSEKQTDGNYISRGVDVTTTYGVHFDPFDEKHIAISYTDIGYHHSYDGGKSWARSTEGISSEWHNTCYWMVFDPEVKGKVWSVWSGLHDFPRGKMTRNPQWKERGKGGVAVSLDGGKTWTPSIEGMGFDSPSTCIVLDQNSPTDNRILYVAAYGKGVFKSTDGGKTWTLRNNGLQGSLAAFELTIQPDGTLFLITSPTPQHRNGKEGTEVFMGAVYKSTDGANTWRQLDVGNRVLFPNGMVADPANLDRLYLAAWSDITLSDLVGKKALNGMKNKVFDLEGGILMSEDGGETWKQVFDENQYVYDVTVDHRYPGRLYANTFNQGAYRSDDHGQTWKKIIGYDFHWGHRVIPDPYHIDKVYLTTFGSSVWHGTPHVTPPSP